MSLIKKINVQEHFIARRALRMAAAQPASLPGLAGIAPTATTAKLRQVLNSFTPVRSSPNVPVNSPSISAGPGLKDHSASPECKQS